jgi:uncharacterized membrane protein
VFSQLRIWDTEHNNGVLVYVLLADRAVEIIADRGIHARADAGVWEAICRAMECAFQDGEYGDGVQSGVQAVAAQLARCFPLSAPGLNELPDRALVRDCQARRGGEGACAHRANRSRVRHVATLQQVRSRQRE